MVETEGATTEVKRIENKIFIYLLHGRHLSKFCDFMLGRYYSSACDKIISMLRFEALYAYADVWVFVNNLLRFIYI